MNSRLRWMLACVGRYQDEDDEENEGDKEHEEDNGKAMLQGDNFYELGNIGLPGQAIQGL